MERLVVSEQSVLNGIASGGTAVPDLEFVKNRAQVCVDRAPAEKKGLGDLRIRHSASQQPQHLDLSRGQLIETARRSYLRLRHPRRRRGSVTRGGQE